MNDLLATASAAWLHTPAALQLGSVLLHFLWQGALLGAIALLLLLLLPSSRPQARYLALVTILFAMAACPAATFFVIQH